MNKLDRNPGVNALSSNKSVPAVDQNSDDAAEAAGKRRGHGRGPVKENDFLAAQKAHPASCEPRRIHLDIEQAQALVRKLDSEKGVEDNILCSVDHDKTNGDNKSRGGSGGPIIIIRGLTSVKGLEGVKLLDTLITYLWRIHGLDYYGIVETNEDKGFRHVRPEGKNHEETTKSGADWEKKLDSFWQERLRGQDRLEVMTAKEKIDAAAVEVLDPFVRKIRDEKYGWKYGSLFSATTSLVMSSNSILEAFLLCLTTSLQLMRPNCELMRGQSSVEHQVRVQPILPGNFKESELRGFMGSDVLRDDILRFYLFINSLPKDIPDALFFMYYEYLF